MGQSIAIPHHRPVAHEPGRRHQLLVGALLGAVLGLIVGALGFAIAQSTVGLVRVALPGQASVAEAPAELPRDWRSPRDAIKLDPAPTVPAHHARHRYRYPEDGATGRLEWIREPGRSAR